MPVSRAELETEGVGEELARTQRVAAAGKEKKSPRARYVPRALRDPPAPLRQETRKRSRDRV
jgi:hypothetical protein